MADSTLWGDGVLVAQRGTVARVSESIQFSLGKLGILLLLTTGIIRVRLSL